MLFQRGTGDIAIFHEPELLLGIPSSVCCFNPGPHRHVKGLDLQMNNRVSGVSRRRRRPVSLLDNQLDRFDPLP